jgi:hypothetical protein
VTDLASPLGVGPLVLRNRVVEHAHVAEEGLLAEAINREGALAFVLLNHADSRAPRSVAGRMTRGPSGVPVPGDSEPTVPMSGWTLRALGVLGLAV